MAPPRRRCSVDLLMYGIVGKLLSATRSQAPGESYQVSGMDVRHDKGYRGDAAQFFVAGELCRRTLVAVVTLGNCPNTDILVSNAAGTRLYHV